MFQYPRRHSPTKRDKCVLHLESDLGWVDLIEERHVAREAA